MIHFIVKNLNFKNMIVYLHNFAFKTMKIAYNFNMFSKQFPFSLHFDFLVYFSSNFRVKQISNLFEDF